MASYEFYLTDDAGRRITALKNIAFMSISRTVRGYGTLHVGIPFKDFHVRPAFLPDRRIEVWRSPSHGATLRREGSFFLRKYNVYVRETDSLEIIEFYGRSPIDILRRQHVTSIVAADYSKTDFIDDMMKEIVDENFVTPPQTVPAGELTVDGGESLGPSISHTFFAQNVFDVLKDLRDISWTLNDVNPANRRIYFDIVEGTPLVNGGYGYSFRTYADQRGTDRTGGIIFSVENGNMESPSYYEDHLDAITHAKVLNFGTPAADGEATSLDATLSRWNDIVSAQQSSEATSALNDSKANQMIQDGKADSALNVTFLDSPGSNRQPRSLYGVDWDLGDLLPVRYADKDFNAEVTIVYLSINEDGKENIVGMSNLRAIAPEEGEEATCVDDFAPYTVALLHADGADASTTFTDQSGKTWSANGNAQLDTAQFKFGSASLLLDGTGDYASSADHADWYFATGSATIDLWVRFNALPSGGGMMRIANQVLDASNFWEWGLRESGGSYSFEFYNDTGGVFTISITGKTTPALSVNTWYHFAWVKNGNDHLFFVNGTQCGTTATDASEVTDIAASVTFGFENGGLGFNGWMDEMRISKGVARWTGNFTPPVLPYCDP